jgi:aryl-alcohol dehydrogenase-like predicted oxidoreductase
VAIEETMRALHDSRREDPGHRGVEFSRAQPSEEAGGSAASTASSPLLSFWRHVEKDAMPYCQANNVTILAYSPMARES